jgi:hypothetical protein
MYTNETKIKYEYIKDSKRILAAVRVVWFLLGMASAKREK